MAFLEHRRRRPEVMDQPGLNSRRHKGALRGLARINLLSGTTGIFWRPLLALARETTTARLRVLDVASGGGDVALRLWRRARWAGLDWQIEGCDLSPVAVAHARRRAARLGAPVRFSVRDALEGPAPGGYDAVISSLFLHHLDHPQAVRLLRRLAGPDAADPPRLLLIDDLARCLTGLIAAHVFSRLLTVSPVVHVDGPRSVEGAFTPAEARGLAAEAGLHGATVVRRWPWRWLLTWRRP
jgi:SAM-dependent methyltransferase